MSKDPYRSVARLYDPLLNPILDRVRREVAHTVALRAKGMVLDLCCGTGRQATFLHEHGLTVTGVDVSEAMLKRARAKTHPAIDYHRNDAADTGFAARSFDGVVISLALHEQDPALRIRVLDEARRLAKPGKTIFVLDYAAPKKSTSPWTELAVRCVERLAGREHYDNYRDFLRRGALPGLCQDIGLPHHTARSFFSGTMELAVLGS